MAQAARKRRTTSSRGYDTAPRVPVFIPPSSNYGITANVSCRATMEEIAALGPERCEAFMAGVGKVIAVLNPRTPVGGQNMR